jgi:hypothetical protein
VVEVGLDSGLDFGLDSFEITISIKFSDRCELLRPQHSAESPQKAECSLPIGLHDPRDPPKSRSVNRSSAISAQANISCVLRVHCFSGNLCTFV